MQDGNYTLADSSAICLYLEKKQPAPPMLPDDICGYGRALWFDAYADRTLFRHVVHPLFAQTIVAPKIQNVYSDTKLIEHVLNDVQPQILGYRESEIEGKVPGRRFADAGRYRHHVEFHYPPIYRL